MTIAFRLAKPEHRWMHWGDFGDLLVHGMTNHLPRKNKLLQLERLGPFVPRAFFPGISDVLLTNELKDELSLAIPNLNFKPVSKTLIVRLHWHEWPASNDEPLHYPEGGDPESYVLGQPHDAALSESLGPIWELWPEIDPEIQGPGGTIQSKRYTGQHFVRANIMGGYNFVSPELRAALLATAPDEVGFTPAQGAQ
jgi:hypothetical protein